MRTQVRETGGGNLGEGIRDGVRAVETREAGCRMRAARQWGGRGPRGPEGGSRAGPRPRPPPRFPSRRASPPSAPRAPDIGRAPTWAFCRALRRSSCTKGFRPGGASRRAPPAPVLDAAPEAGASRGPRSRSLMAAPPSARVAAEPGGPNAERGAERSGARSRARAEDARQLERARRAAAQAREGLRCDVGGGRRRGGAGAGLPMRTPPTAGRERRPQPCPAPRTQS